MTPSALPEAPVPDVAHSERVLAIVAVDRPRTLAAITTLLVGRGHHLSWLDASPQPDGRTLVTIGLPIDRHAAERLSRQLERLVEVMGVTVLEVAAAEPAAQVERYHLATRGTAEATVSEAVVTLRVDGIRRLGAGDGARPLVALSRATVAALGHGPRSLDVEAATVIQRPAGWCGVVSLADGTRSHVAAGLDRVEEHAVVGAIVRAAAQAA